MECLLRSHLPQLIILFRDYIRGKYAVELTIREEHHATAGITELAAYLSSNSPHFAEIKQEADRFAADPFDDNYQRASWESGDTKTMRHQSVKLNLSQFLLRCNSKKFTTFLTALCAIIFAFEWFGYEQQIMGFAHYPAEIGEESEIWRYFSHTVVHLSPLHILFNLSWWWIFSGAIERCFSSLTLIGLLLISAVITGITQNWASGPTFFGLSGVVYAVMGFVFAIDKFGETKRTVLPKGFLTMLVIGIGFGFLSPLVGVEMGNAAHISGLIIGLVLGFLQVKVRSK